MLNVVVLDAEVVSTPQLRDDGTYKARVACRRDSGVWDEFELHFSSPKVCTGDYIRIVGHAHSIMRKGVNYIDKGILIADKPLGIYEGEPKYYENEVIFEDAEFCKIKEYRKSHSDENKMVMTYTIKHGESGLFHITTWGKSAEGLYEEMSEGAKLSFRGRLQAYKPKKSTKPSFGIITYLITSVTRKDAE